MTVKHTLVSLDMRVFALCSLMELHRNKAYTTIVEFTLIVDFIFPTIAVVLVKVYAFFFKK